MLKLTRFSVNRPVTVLMVFFAVLLIGGFSFTYLKIDLLPEIEPPVIHVITVWPGASATDVESEVTKEIEDYMATISGLDELRSKSVDNISVVSCIFKWGKDLTEAANDIRDQLDLAKKHLPEGVEEPLIFKFSSSMSPVMVLVFTAKESYPQLYHIIDKRVEEALRRIPGVGTTVIFGGLERQINVILDIAKLEAYKIPLSNIKRILLSENLTIPAGTTNVGSKEFYLRVPGRYRSVREVADTVIGVFNGNPVYLKDVAEVEDGYAEEIMKAWGNGNKSIVLIIRKQTDANTVEVARRIREKIPYLKSLLPKDGRVYIAMDSSEFIKLAIRRLATTLFQGLAVVMLVTFLFIRRLGASFIIGLSIPFSLIITFILMFAGNYTINLVSLSSLAIASGMVVDNAVVILENISRYIERGVRPKVAATIGAAEVGSAVLASTLTTLAVFIPMMFLSGFAGIMFKQLAFIMTVSVSASLFISLTLIPSMASRRLKKHVKEGFFYRLGEWVLRSLESFYRRLLSFALRFRWLVIIIAVLGMVLTVFLFKHIGTELIPNPDTGEISITFSLPEGTRLEVTEQYVKKIMKFVEDNVPERVNYYGFCGRSEEGIGVAMGFEEGSNHGEVGIKLVPKTKRKRSAEEIADTIRAYIKTLPGIDKYDVTTSTFKRAMFFGAKSIDVEIAGDDLKTVLSIATKIKKILWSIKGAVGITISQKEPRPEIWIKVDREKASFLGVNMALLADAMRTYFQGDSPTEYREKGEDYDIKLRLRKDQRNNVALLSEIPIPTINGGVVKLGSFASIERKVGPVEIDRKDRQKVVSVQADVRGRALGDVERDLKGELSKLKLPPGVTITFGGETKQKRETFADLIKVLALGIILVYMVMASQFEAFLDPFVIMFSVPFAFTGVALGLYVFGQPLSTMAFLGVIMLVGIVVNNAIVLVDYTNLLRARGYRLFDAVLETGVRRLRPVLMTSLTTVGGMVPMLLSRGEGSEVWKPLASVMIGGLTFSTLVTLVLVPVVYTIVEQYIRRKKRFAEGREGAR